MHLIRSQANRDPVYKKDKKHTITIKPSPEETIPNIFKQTKYILKHPINK